MAALATGFSVLPFGNIFKLSPAEAWEGFVFPPLVAHGKNWPLLLAAGWVPSHLLPAVDGLQDGWRRHLVSGDWGYPLTWVVANTKLSPDPRCCHTFLMAALTRLSC